MNKRISLHITYWILILLLLSLFFGYKWNNHILAFYFSSLLLPVVLGTTYFFNLYLVPGYLLTGKYAQFILYFLYMLVASLYLEMLVALLSFAIIANYKVDVMDLESISIFILGLTLYLVVFVTSFARIALQFREKSQLINSLQSELEKKAKASVVIRANRKNNHILLDELLYIESLDDYVRVVTTRQEFNAREKISKLCERLPDQFIRIHRSFVVNKEKVLSFNKSEVRIGSTSLPVSRTYKNTVIEALERAEDISE